MIEDWKYAEKQRKNSLSQKDVKEELREKFIKKLSIKVNNKGGIENVEDYDKFKELYRKLKNKYDGLYKDNEKLKTDLKQRTEHHYKKLEESVINAKQNNYKLKQENEKLFNDFAYQKVETNRLINEILSLNEELKKRDIEQKDLTKAFNNIKNKMNMVNKRNDDLQSILNGINGKMNAKYVTEILDLKNENNAYKKIIQKQQEELQILLIEMERSISSNPHFLLEKLYDELTINNATSYFLVENLNRKYKFTLNNYYKINFLNENIKEERSLFGHVRKIDYMMIFVDLEGLEYIVNHHVGEFLDDETPVAAYENEDGTVDVYWYYKTDLLMKNDYYKYKNIKNISGEKQEAIEIIGDFKVLLLTSLNGIRYRDRLRQHGINAQWVDPFEKSPIHIKGLMEKSDMVIMCVENMPHDVSNFVENGNEKYQFLTNHNENIVFERVKSTAIRIGLIKEVS